MFNKRNRGVGLVEAALFTVLSLAMIVAGIVYFHQASTSERVNSAIRSIVSMQNGVRSLYQTSNSFGEKGADLSPVALSSGAVPSNLIGDNGQIINEWAGPVTIRGYSSGFIIDYAEVPYEACVRLAPFSNQGSGPAGTGIAAVSINGTIHNSDGELSPADAASACTGADASVIAMRWAFAGDANSTLSAEVVEEMLGPDVVEIDRTTETDIANCDAGFSGQKNRTRLVISFSNGKVQAAPWSDWNTAACVAIVETGRTIQTENQACPTGQFGQQIRSREVVTFSDDTSTATEWSAWDAAGCETLTLIETRLETESLGCDGGANGQKTRTRSTQIFNDGSTVPGAWSAWDISSCGPTIVATFDLKRDTVTSTICAGGAYVVAHYARAINKWSDGTIGYGSERLIGNESCPSPSGTSQTMYTYQECDRTNQFGYTRRSSQVYLMKKAGNGNWTAVVTSSTGYGTCNRY